VVRGNGTTSDGGNGSARAGTAVTRGSRAVFDRNGRRVDDAAQRKREALAKDAREQAPAQQTPRKSGVQSPSARESLKVSAAVSKEELVNLIQQHSQAAARQFSQSGDFEILLNELAEVKQKLAAARAHAGLPQTESEAGQDIQLEENPVDVSAHPFLFSENLPAAPANSAAMPSQELRATLHAAHVGSATQAEEDIVTRLLSPRGSPKVEMVQAPAFASYETGLVGAFGASLEAAAASAGHIVHVANSPGEASVGAKSEIPRGSAGVVH
jgi:hypothetical protein